jgi:hypothetical protein
VVALVRNREQASRELQSMFYNLHQLSCGTRDSKISRNLLQSNELGKIRLYIPVLSLLPGKSGNSKES